MKRNKIIARAAAVLGCTLICLPHVAADEEYLSRSDTVTRGAHESVEFNKATQTINRWPIEARRDRWLWDGERARTAIERYRSRAPGISPETMQPPATSSDVTK